MIDVEQAVVTYLSALKDTDIVGYPRDCHRCLIAMALGSHRVDAAVWACGFETDTIPKQQFNWSMTKLVSVFDSILDDEVTKHDLLDKLAREHMAGNKFLDAAGPLFALLTPDLEG